MNIRDAIFQRMTADAPLLTLLTGGVYQVAELSPTMEPPTPFDEVGRMRPAALVRKETSTSTGPRGRFDRQFGVVFFYDVAGYGVIDEALERTREILHEQRVGNGAYELRHVDTVDDQYDDSLLAYMHRARYELARRG